MNFWGDDRGAAIQIGAVILFAFVVIAMASYQATVVPSQNSGVEFNHNQDVQSQMVDLTTGLDASARDGTRGSHAVRLGTTYPSRTFFVNPGPPSGQLRTVESGQIEFENIVVSDSESATVTSYWETAPEPVTTSRLQYVPDYSEYRAAPTTVYEYGALINDNPQGTPTQFVPDGVVDRNEIMLIALRGDVQQASSTTVSVNRRALSSSANTVTIKQGTIRLPTEYPGYWVDQLADRNGIDVAENGDTVEITIRSGETFDLRMARVGVGDVTSVDSGPDERATYVAATDDEAPTVSAEVRDEYNNPVAGATFEYEVDGGPTQSGTTDRNGLAVVDGVSEGETVRIRIGGEDWEEVAIDARANSGGGGGEQRRVRCRLGHRQDRSRERWSDLRCVELYDH
ncbi:Ig-like domain-containing protein [Natronoarchaeum sp. GCM10025703]|uniref:Ig-like domain-containing protein n=1 Tax=Natronoarchaeum sp. GCM10025703 TaxID=3252685 RepID=UPI003610FC51